MIFRTCAYEKEVTQALKDGHWPDGCAAELRTHVEACTSCGDLVLVAETFQRARSESLQEALPGSPSLLWWRAQLRQRAAAAERVSRPVTVAQGFAWLVTLIVAAVLVTSQYNHGLRWASWWATFNFSRMFQLLSLGVGMFDGNLTLLIPILSALALLSGLVVYLASGKS
jgi:hypothetical protein